MAVIRKENKALETLQEAYDELEYSADGIREIIARDTKRLKQREIQLEDMRKAIKLLKYGATKDE